MKNINKTAVVFGTSLVAGLGSTSLIAAENPFAVSELSNGYLNMAEVDTKKDGETKMKDGACGEGKCGSAMGSSNKNMEGSCGGKGKEGACGDKTMGTKKAGEGKCGEGKCGGSK